MKKLIFFFLIPLAVNAQQPAQQDSKHLPGSSSEVQTTSYEKKSAREIAEDLRKRVLAGEAMSVLASKYTEDPGSAKNGGVYVNVKMGQMVEEFDKVAFSLMPGDISEVFETQFGFHFIQLIAINGQTRDLRHILIKHR